MKLTFRELAHEDIPSCIEILKLNYPSEHFWVDTLIKDIQDVFNKLYPSEFIVVLLEEKIVGFGCQLENGFKNVYCITWINISPSYQGKGIGKLLVTELERRIRAHGSDMGYIALETDKPIFYEKLGYKTIRKKEEKDIMAKTL